MAVSVNTVYTTVLYILNKEQRGYVTPSEFNSIADLVQKEIFNSYFPNGNQQNRKNQNNSENDTEFFNMFEDIEYKLSPFKKDITLTYDSANNTFYNATSSSIYKIGEVLVTYTGQPKYESIAQLVNKRDFEKITRSKLTSPTKEYPLFITTNATPTSLSNRLALKISPWTSSTSGSVVASCLLNPTSPNWNFTVGSVGQYIYSANGSVDFQLDISEQTNLIINILKYFGIVINDPTIIQVAEQESQAVQINEKS